MQRNLYLLIFFSFCTGTVSAQEKRAPNFTLTGTFSGKHAHTISLTYRDTSGNRIGPEARIKKGTFSLSSYISSPVYAFILSDKKIKPQGPDVSNGTELFLTPGNMTIALREDDFEHAVLKGSPLQDEWIKLQALQDPVNNIKDSLYSIIFAIDRAGHTDSSLAARWAVAEKIAQCNKQIDQIDYNYITSHPQSYLSAWLLDNLSQVIQLDSVERPYNAFPDSIRTSISGHAIKREIDNRKKDEYTQTYYSPGGTYSDWYFPSNESYQSLEWTFVPVVDPPASLAKEGLLHYYAYNFALVNASSAVGGGYAGFQTNGVFKDQTEGKVINFSIWGSNAGKTNGLLNKANDESGGVQIMYRYDWVVGHKYYFELKQGPSGIDSLGKWWGLWVTDKNTGRETFVGEQKVPARIDGQIATAWSDHTSMFGEDLHWWHSLEGEIKYTDCSAFQGSSMAAIDITANGGKVKPLRFVNMVNSGQPVTGSNGFKSVNCAVSLYQDSTNFNVQHNLGYWPTPAPNIITASPAPAQHASK